jgi:site-specific DNA recombinase
VAKADVYLFTGYAHCSCGSKMYVWKQSPKYICPKCRNKIPMNDLEAVYRDQLAAFVVSPDALADHAQAANERVREAEALVAAAEAELAKVESEAERLYRLYMDDGLSKDDFGRKHRPLSERRTQLEDELPRLQAKRDVLRVSALSEAVVQADAVDLASGWDRLSEPEKRHLVETITDRIVVGKGEVAVNLLYFPGEVRKQRGHAAADI